MIVNKKNLILIQKQYNKLILLNLDRAEGSTMFFIIEETKETALNFSGGTVKDSNFIFLL